MLEFNRCQFAEHTPTLLPAWKKLNRFEYNGTTNDVHIWNDMNEPSVFSGPEITMHKDAIHHGGFEHREVHNLYGFYQVLASFISNPNFLDFEKERLDFEKASKNQRQWTESSVGFSRRQSTTQDVCNTYEWLYCVNFFMSWMNFKNEN